jgi:hypothetical protein
VAVRGTSAQPAMPVIGFLNARSPDDTTHLLAAFRQGLADGGFIERQNVTIEYRWAEGQYERLPALAAEIAGRPVDVIVATGGEPAALAAPPPRRLMNSRRRISAPKLRASIVSAQTGRLIGLKSSIKTLPQRTANVGDGS